MINKKRKALTTQLTKLISTNQIDEFYQLIESDEAKKVIPEYNRTFLKLNCAIYSKNKKEATKCFDALCNTKQGKNATEIYYQCFDYFILVNDDERAKLCYDYIMKKEKIQQNRLVFENIYAIMVEKKTDALDSLLEETEAIPDSKKYMNETLIAMIYGKIGDKEREEQYKKMARMHLESVGK